MKMVTINKHKLLSTALKKTSCGCLLILLFLSGCMDRIFEMGPIKNDQVTMQANLDVVESLILEVNTKDCVTQLDLVGRTAELFEATFQYNIDEWRPIIHYQDKGSEVAVTIEAPSCTGMLDTPVNSWALKLNPTLPLTLNVNYRKSYYEVGTPALDLRGLLFRQLQLNIEGSDTYQVDLSGPWTESFEAQITTIEGLVTVLIPNSVGVVVIPDGIGTSQIEARGLTESGGQYFNAAHATSDVTINLTLSSESGKFILQEAP